MNYSEPAWITSPLSPYDIAAINQGGCASGAYMDAVTYNKATEVMAEHGDDVLQFIEDHYGYLPEIPKGQSWSGIAVFYLSIAVDLHCSIWEHLEDWNDAKELAA